MSNVILFYYCCKDHYKLAFKKHIFSIFKFWRQEVQKQVLSWIKMRMLVVLFLWEDLGRMCLDFSIFYRLPAFPGSWPSSRMASFWLLILSSFSLILSSPFHPLLKPFEIQVWWYIPWVPAFRRQRYVNLCEFWTILVYMTSSRTCKATQPDPISKYTQANRKNICEPGMVESGG